MVTFIRVMDDCGYTYIMVQAIVAFYEYDGGTRIVVSSSEGNRRRGWIFADAKPEEVARMIAMAAPGE